MSHSLLDRLYIGVEPHRLTLVRLRRGWKPRIVAAETLNFEDAFPGYLGNSTLIEVLRSRGWQGAKGYWTLSDRLVRYFIAPLPQGARNARELDEAAAMRLEDILGEEAKHWTISLDRAPLVSEQLACAFRKTGQHALENMAQQLNVQISNLAPFSVTEFNRHEREIGRRSGWVASATADTVWLGYKSGHAWRSVGVHERPEGDLPIAQWVTQARLRTLMPTLESRSLWLLGTLRPETVTIGDLVLKGCHAGIWVGKEGAWSETYRLALAPVWRG